MYATAGTGLFFATITALEGRPHDVPAVLAAKFWPTLAANWAVWPAAHLVNFRFVPARFRLLYNNSVAVAWLALLSAITHARGGAGGGAGGAGGVAALLQHVLPHHHHAAM